MQGPRNVPFQLAPPVDTQCTLPKLCPRIVMAGPRLPRAKREREGSQAAPVLTGAEFLQHTNPPKTLYRNHSKNWWHPYQ